MCIILTCEKYVRPDRTLLRTCFHNNPDGAGIMWCEDGMVQTWKGFMSLGELEGAIGQVPNDSRLVIHMRIATSGGINTGTCHPFPVCDDLELLHKPAVTCGAAIAHNGVISNMPTDADLGISDTVSFVSGVVTSLYQRNHFKVTKPMQKRIKEAAPGNRFALMTKDGEVYRMGNGWNTVTKGIQASNATWKYDKYFSLANYGYSYGGGYYGYFDDGDEDGYSDDYKGIFEYYGCKDCPSMGSCMAYEPFCPDVAEAVEDWYRWVDEDEEEDELYVWPTVKKEKEELLVAV